MRWIKLSTALICATLACIACSERESVVAASSLDPLPTTAQPRLATTTLYVGAEEVTAEVASRPREIQTGMMFRTNVVDGDAMLFVLPRPRQAQFWMKNCPTPLSCAYINPDGIILEIHEMEPLNTNSIVAGSSNILFVLETAHGWFDRNNVRTGMLVTAEGGSLLESFFKRQTR